ncbi:MAG: hypothetical protein KatS3mg076_1207 [Candidatus Binatia bacterium]|nr:MAG: hypothetical protein KatS3mg076_1207 [Candidatus Binatia bacterium]
MAVARVVLVPPQGELRELDYEVPPEWAHRQLVGRRVLVPLGRRRAVGVVVETPDRTDVPALKPLVSVLDEGPVLDSDLLSLCKWVADYYLCSVGAVLEAALPERLRARLVRVVVSTVGESPLPEGGDEEERELLRFLHSRRAAVRLSTVRAAFGEGADRLVRRLAERGLVRVEERLEGVSRQESRSWPRVRVVRGPTAEEEKLLGRRPALRRLWERVSGGTSPLRGSELKGLVRDARRKLEILEELGLVALEPEDDAGEPGGEGAVTVPELTGEQRNAVDAVVAAVEGGSFAPFLLFGVTGSGKTEVYLRAVERVLALGRNALVLVPEISLTHQLVSRLRQRFGAGVAVLHSGLRGSERWKAWRELREGRVRIAIGARSAVFAPVRNLGLVVVDEEHDGAYKQEEGVRYHARDVAVVRARMAGCPVVLGSATPSMESYWNARAGRYRLLELGSRVEGRPLPEVELVDLRGGRFRVLGGVPLSEELEAAVRANFAARGQTLLFLNRRGFAKFLQCRVCGCALRCLRCSVGLTFHRKQRRLRCHHCDFSEPPPPTCPDCGEPAWTAWGAGTERLEDLVREILPGARVARLDRDVAGKAERQRGILEAWEARRFDVLVGTQMVTKGHDVPGVTLVGVLLADQSLEFPDFRSAERTFQLLTQVAGRAGRGEKEGRVLIQTFQPSHYSLRSARTHDFRSFAEEELRYRREARYPPFSRLLLVRCECRERSRAEEFSLRVAEEVRGRHPDVEVLGPAPAPLERLRGRYRWRVLLRARTRASLRSAAARVLEDLAAPARRAGVRLAVDVDPHHML